MSNPYYTRIFSAIDGSLARAAAVLNEFTLVQAAFDAVYTRISQLAPAWWPSSIGAALTIMRVNAAGTAIEFVSPGRLPIVAVSASRALLATDGGKLLVCSNGTAATLTVPLNATTAIDVETALVIYQGGAGKVTLAPEAGVTLRAADSLLSTRTQFAQITLIKIATNEWVVGGDRAA
jgi:hypothetical protein